MTTLLARPRLLDALRNAPPVVALIAPAGFGKSVVLEQAAASELRLVQVQLGLTEGHPALFIDAIAQGLRRAYPGTAIGAVRTIAGLRGPDGPVAVFTRAREALGAATLTLAFDELERLPPGPVLQLIERLLAERPDTLRIVLTSRDPVPAAIEAACMRAVPTQAKAALATLGADALAFDTDETAELAGPTWRGRVPGLVARTGGWPALVAAALRAGPGHDDAIAVSGPIVDEAVAGTGTEARFVLQIASVLGTFSTAMMVALASGDVPGAPEARRRLVRLEPAVVRRAMDELARLSLLRPQTDGTSSAESWEVLPGLRHVMSERLHAKDRGAWLEAHRRAGELVAASEAPRVTPALVDLFAAAGERDRVVELLSKHGPRLELELERAGEHARLLGWTAAVTGVRPFWIDVLAGLALARGGSLEKAREHLDKARDRLATEKKDAAIWRWQARMAEAQALTARAKGDSNEARSWLARGLDQVGQAAKRGLPNSEEKAEALQLEARLFVTLARHSRETSGWDKTKEALLQALASLRKSGLVGDARIGELRRSLIAHALAAGDAAVLESEAKIDDAIGRAAQAVVGLLKSGGVDAARASLEAVGDEEIASLLLVRLADGPTRAQALERLHLGGDEARGPLGLEADLRAGRTGEREGEARLEGYLAAVALDAAASGPGRAFDLARDTYRRNGARWDEARMWLTAAAHAARRVEDGDGDQEGVAKAVDGAVEIAAAVGFVLPWGLAGRGERDPERRVKSILIAGLRAGHERTRQACKAELERRGIDARAITGPTERVRPVSGSSRRPAIVGGAPYVSWSRTGQIHGMSANDYQALVAAKAPTQLVVCVADQVVLNFGRSVSLGQKRVMLPLLLFLLRHPDECFSMAELARTVWDSPELTPTVQTKVKVAVSRLRALLGKNRSYINTTRKMEGGESVVAYQVAPQLSYVIIDSP
jgi:hypothetical protein